jgi:hypothetical protein
MECDEEIDLSDEAIRAGVAEIVRSKPAKEEDHGWRVELYNDVLLWGSKEDGSVACIRRAHAHLRVSEAATVPTRGHVVVQLKCGEVNVVHLLIAMSRIAYLLETEQYCKYSAAQVYQRCAVQLVAMCTNPGVEMTQRFLYLAADIVLSINCNVAAEESDRNDSYQLTLKKIADQCKIPLRFAQLAQMFVFQLFDHDMYARVLDHFRDSSDLDPECPSLLAAISVHPRLWQIQGVVDNAHKGAYEVVALCDKQAGMAVMSGVERVCSTVGTRAEFMRLVNRCRSRTRLKAA